MLLGIIPSGQPVRHMAKRLQAISWSNEEVDMNQNPEPQEIDEDNIVSPPRVIVKFKEGKAPPYQSRIEGYDSIGDYIQKNNIGPWANLAERFPGISINLIFVSVDPETISNLVKKAQDMDRSYQDPNFLSYFAVEYDKVPEDTSYEELFRNMQIIQKEISSWENVELAYIQPGLAPLPAIPTLANNNQMGLQEYLNPANQSGVNAYAAWAQAGGSGLNIDFIDIERGWDLAHQDLSALPISLLAGANKEAKMHGTSTLGVVVGRDNVTNTIGVVGIAYQANAGVVSIFPTATSINADHSNAIMTALTNLNYGDVLLVEDQRKDGTRVISGITYDKLWPIETAPLIWEVIYLGTTLGIIIIEPAGNGLIPQISTNTVPSGTDGNDLSGFTDSSGNHIFDETITAEFKDSRAIVVGSATEGESSDPQKHYRTLQSASALPSNYGTRIDCFGWGEWVWTSGGGPDANPTHDSYRYFDGTSSASAMVASVVLVIQSLAVNILGFRLGPIQMRSILSNSQYGTPVNAGVLPDPNALEGYLPDLQKILSNYFNVDHEDIFIRDNLTDTGDSHNGAISVSPDIIIRNNQTTTNPSTNASYYSTNRDVDDSENITTGGAGATAYIYVRAFNRGAAPANNVELSLYYSRPGTLITPVDWTPIVTNSAFGMIPAKAPGTTGVNGVHTVEITWNSIPADGHYCFIGLVGNAYDPLIDPKVPPVVDFYHDFDNFYKFIRENNNATWKNFNVGPISSSMRMGFFVAGANDRPRPMGLEIAAGLPEGAQLWLQGRDEFLFALQGRGAPNLEHDREKGLARIRVNPYGPYRFRDTVFPKDLHEPLELIIDLPEGQYDKPYQLFVRQLYQGEEVGRVTWQLTPPDQIPVGGVTPAERRCIRLGRLWVALLALLVVLLGIHPLAGYLTEIIVGLSAALVGWAWYQACHPDNATFLKKLALGLGIGIVLLAAGIWAGLW
jgi:serine protease